MGRLLYVSVRSKDSVPVGWREAVRTGVTEEVGAQETLSVGSWLNVSVTKSDGVTDRICEAVAEFLAVTEGLLVHDVVAVSLRVGLGVGVSVSDGVRGWVAVAAGTSLPVSVELRVG